MNSDEVNTYLEEEIYKITETNLREMANNNPTEGFVRFFSGLADHVLGVFLPADETEDFLHLHFAQYKTHFEAYALPIPIHNKSSNEIAFVFAREIIRLNPEFNLFHIYNYLQYHYKTALEAMGYFTYNPFEINNDMTLVGVGHKGFKRVWQIDMVEFLRQIYDSGEKGFSGQGKCVYLFVDTDTGYIKIGKSKNPKFREGTLQSKKPTIHMISFWNVPSSTEKELHLQYAHKRKRGEWFNLTLEDLDEITFHLNKVEASSSVLKGDE